MSDSLGTADLDSGIADLYRRPLEEFVARRDGLAKELRAEGRREEAQQVKSLRKPSRTAWALNAAVGEDPEVVERCAAAIGDALEAQSGGGDLRAAYDELRAAVRSLAAAAARASDAAGHGVDQADLVPAASAVIGDASAFEDLRARRLVAIPQAGGLDRLTGMPPPATRASKAKSAAKPSAKSTKAPEAESDQALTQARDALRDAEATARAAARRSEAAARALQKAQKTAEAAEGRLQEAERKAQVRRAQLNEARQEAETAEAHERQADDAVEQARSELERLERKR